MSIDLTKYRTYDWYAENDGGLQAVLGGFPSIPLNEAASITFADLFRGIFGTRYLCYPETDPPMRWAWSEEASGLLQLNGGGITERLATVCQLMGRALTTQAQDGPEFMRAPIWVVSSSNYRLAGEVITRQRFPSFDEIRQYEDLRPLISDLMRRFDGLFLPVVYGWDDQWPEPVT